MAARSWKRLYSCTVSSETLTSFIMPSAALVNCEPASILNLASMLRSASSETDFWFSNRFDKCWQ